VGANPICEKPLVLNPWNLDALEELEKEAGIKIYNILQLRVHEAIISLRDKIRARNTAKKHEIDLTYITSRGKWYFYSWKGDIHKSGGVATNIGIHFFDMLMWIFGKVQRSEVHLNDPKKMAGFIELERANVRWYLSLDKDDLPANIRAKGQPTFRSIKIDGEELEFSGGFTDLHTVVYRDILQGGGYGIGDARPSIELVHDIRHAKLVQGEAETMHPMIRNR